MSKEKIPCQPRRKSRIQVFSPVLLTIEDTQSGWRCGVRSRWEENHPCSPFLLLFSLLPGLSLCWTQSEARCSWASWAWKTQLVVTRWGTEQGKGRERHVSNLRANKSGLESNFQALYLGWVHRWEKQTLKVSHPFRVVESGHCSESQREDHQDTFYWGSLGLSAGRDPLHWVASSHLSSPTGISE